MHTHTHRKEDGPAKTEAELGSKGLQGCWPLPKARKSQKRCFQQLEHGPVDIFTSYVGPPQLREYISVVLDPPGCGTLSHQLQETYTCSGSPPSVPHGFFFVNGFYVQNVMGEHTSFSRSSTQQAFIRCRRHVREHPQVPAILPLSTGREAPNNKQEEKKKKKRKGHSRSDSA